MNRKTILPMLIVAALIITAMMSISSAPSKAASDKIDESMLIDIRLDGPDAVGANVSEDFYLNISYAYPERVQTTSYTAKVSSPILGGGSIYANNGTSENNGTSPVGAFKVGIKGAWNAGKMIVEINATVVEVSGTTWYRVKEFEIEVVKPIFFTATLVNNGYADVKNVTVKMIVDGEVERVELYNLTAQQAMELNFSWVFSSMTEGEHLIKLVVNDPQDIIEFSTGNDVYTFNVYYSESGNLLRGILTIMIIFVAIILVLTYLQKKPSAKSK